MPGKGTGFYTSSKLYDGAGVSSESCLSEPIPLYDRDADKNYALVIEKIKAMKRITSVPQHCTFCGTDEEEAYILRVKRKGEEEWTF